MKIQVDLASEFCVRPPNCNTKKDLVACQIMTKSKNKTLIDSTSIGMKPYKKEKAQVSSSSNWRACHQSTMCTTILIGSTINHQ